MSVKYQPLTVADLARLVAGERDFDSQWRLVVEFLKEYHEEPAGVRLSLLEDAPGPVGDERWQTAVMSRQIVTNMGTSSSGQTGTGGRDRAELLGEP